MNYLPQTPLFYWGRQAQQLVALQELWSYTNHTHCTYQQPQWYDTLQQETVLRVVDSVIKDVLRTSEFAKNFLRSFVASRLGL